MEDINDSDILKTQMDLLSLSTSAFDASTSAMPIHDIDESLQPSTTSARGFCVKEYEEEMQNLKKENFNLKLRIYFLEEKNPNVPEGAETIYKQNIDLKIDNQNLLKEVQEKQELLCQASKALELLDDEKIHNQQRQQMVVDELNSKIEALQHEVTALQNAVADANKTGLGNDTGFTEFLGAVDSKDIDYQRKVAELTEIESKFELEKAEMENRMKDLQRQKGEIEMKVSNLLYENDEVRDKLDNVEKKMGKELKKLKQLQNVCVQKFNEIDHYREDNEFLKSFNERLNEKCEELEMTVMEVSYLHEDGIVDELNEELRKFKDMWASAQCDLQDTEDKLKESEKERLKTVSMLKSAFEELSKQTGLAEDLQNQLLVTGAGTADERTKNNIENLLTQKNNEIKSLKADLTEVKKQLQEITNQELAEKNREIKKLQTSLKSLQIERSSLSTTPRFSLEQLSESFNDLKFQQAMEVKKNSQKKIDELMNQLAEVANTSTKNHVNQLQEQMKIVVEKQEITDNALGKCADLCSYTLDHLHELARFLASLLKQKEFRDSLDQLSLSNIENVLEKTLEFTQNPGRFSTVDGNVSLLANISSLDLLMTSARESLANVKVFSEKSMQVDEVHVKELENELQTVKSEAEDLNRVNQMLEDEIYKFKKMLEDCKSQMLDNDNEITDLKMAKNSLNSMLQESQNKFQVLTVAHYELEQKMQEEIMKKFECDKRLDSSELMVANLENAIDTMRQDLEVNWIAKVQHEEIVKKLEEDVVNGEAEVAAIRMEMELVVNNLKQLEAERAVVSAEVEDNKENLEIINQIKAFSGSASDLRNPEASTSRPESPVDGVVAISDGSCPMCPKYVAKITALKKYLTLAVEKIKKTSEKERLQAQNIQKQLSSTESFLHSARSNMEIILKNRNSNQGNQ